MEKWAEGLVKEVYSQWKEYKGKYECWAQGFGVFYSPIVNEDKSVKPILIIGWNPGSSDKECTEQISKDFKNELKKYENGDFSLPTEHEYLDYWKDDSYSIIRGWKSIFKDDENFLKRVFKNSVKTNVIFFRSKREKDDIPEKLIKFSSEKTKEIIKQLRPSVIIAEGVTTFDKIEKLLKGKNFKRKKTQLCLPIEYKNRRCRLYCKTTIATNGQDISLIGIYHPSYANTYESQRDKLYKFLKEELKQIIK